MSSPLSVPTRRGRLIAATVVLFLAGWPIVFDPDPYVLSVLILTLWFAQVGVAWNVMTGFAGQLSLGHALYIGLGGYTAGGLFVFTGLGPWLGLWAGIAVAMVAGGGIGALGFRFGVRGVQFALLTIAFAEVARIGFDHFDALGGSGGLFLPVPPGRAANDVLALRGEPLMFYFVILGLTLVTLVIAWLLLNSRLGWFWIAVREDQDAARALGIHPFRVKLAAVAVSAGLTAPAGVFQAFYYNHLFPEQVFSMARSLEVILAPICGGLGTLLGPVIGAFILTPVGELITVGLRLVGADQPGLKQLVFGLALIGIIRFRPAGLWPWFAVRLGLVERPPSQP